MWRSPKAIIHCFGLKKGVFNLGLIPHIFSITAEIVSFNNSITTAALCNYMVPTSFGMFLLSPVDYGIKFFNRRIPVSEYDFNLFMVMLIMIFTEVPQNLINYGPYIQLLSQSNHY